MVSHKLKFYFLIGFFMFMFDLLFLPSLGIQILLANNYLLGDLLGGMLRILIFLLIYWIYRTQYTDGQHGTPVTWIDVFALSLLTYGMQIFLSFLLAIVFLNAGGTGSQLLESFSGEPGLNMEYVVILFNVLIVAPVVEEMFYRWLFFKIADRYQFPKFDYAIKLSINIGIFTAAHMAFSSFSQFYNSWQFYGFFHWLLFSTIIYVLYTKTRRLDYVIVYHSLTNLYSSLYNMYYLFSGEGASGVALLLTWIPMLVLPGFWYRDSISRLMARLRGDWSNQEQKLVFLLVVFGTLLATISLRQIVYLGNQMFPGLVLGIIIILGLLYFPVLAAYLGQAQEDNGTETHD